MEDAKRLQIGIDINFQDRNGITPLYLSVFHNQTKLVSYFLLNNADINLADNDSKVSISIIENYKKKINGKISKDIKSELKAKEKFILSITENGFGKRTSHYDFRVTNRGGKGIIGIVNSKRNGNVSSSFPVFEGDQILISTDKGRVIRTSVKEIRIAGRNTQGVKIIKLSGDEKVVSAIKIDDNLL